MTTNSLVHLGENLYLIDTFDLGLPGRTGSYVLVEEDGLSLIETSASPSKPYIEKGLKALGFGLDNIRRIILTHIHLDHAGGAGLFAKACPNAEIIVHPKGLRHLAEPERLITGARAVYGKDFDRLFNPILPVPFDQLKSFEDGEALELGPDRTLTFLDTPGHAKHHYGIFDSKTKGMFVGDTIGVRYAYLEEVGAPLYLPSTSPNQFDPEDMLASMEKIKACQPERLYFGHYSMSENTAEVYRQVTTWLGDFLSVAETVVKRGGGHPEIVEGLRDVVWTKTTARRLPEDHPERQMIEMDLQVSAMGLLDYFNRKYRD